MSSTDRIEKRIDLNAPRSRVWQAITDSAQFGHWFGVEVDGPFVAGATMRWVIVPTQVDPEVAAGQEPYEGVEFEVDIEAIEPMTRFAFRWHPYAIDEGLDLSDEPPTLVELTLSDAPGGGTRLEIVESGFDRIPLERRAKAFEMNEGGWEAQMQLIRKYLDREAA